MSDIIKDLGGPTAVARMLGIKAPSVVGWGGRIPVERRVAIERAAYPRFTVESAGDDVMWQRIPDPEWPHPEGRPCIDVAVMHGVAHRGR
jgi:DNA-binding transcriptional regulator YdaS (Cro superfamily)